MLLYLLLSVVIFLGFLHFAIHNTKSAKLINQLPGPHLIPVLGNAHDFLCGPISFFYKIRQSSKTYQNTTKIYRIWVFHRPVVELHDLDDIETFLSSPKFITKGYFYRFLHPWLKEGLLTSTGEKWQQRRKILTPSFHFNILRQFCKIFIHHTDVLIEKLKQENGKETDVKAFITTFTLHAICETAMGYNLDSKQEKALTYKQSIYDIIQLLIHRALRMWLYPDFIFNVTPTAKEMNKVLSRLYEFTTGVIRERREMVKDKLIEEVEDTNEYDIGMKKRAAMLDVLLKAEAENKMDEDAIREEVDTFMFEGHDTTTMAITFSLMMLANHPDIQDRILEEQNKIMNEIKRMPNCIEDFSKMHYLERCLKECLRLYPSVPSIGRLLKEDMHLKNHVIPAGTSVHLQIFDLHRNPTIYPNPERFDPDRFLAENTKNRHPFSYIPFSAGPRNCIGQKFALLEEKVVLSSIIRTFKLEAITKPEEIVFTADMVLRCTNTIKIKFIPRDS